MAGDIKLKYAAAQTLPATIASLANNAARQSDQVDNSTNQYQDALVSAKITTGASGTSSAGAVIIYAFGSADDNTSRTENAGASDASITLTSPTNARLVGAINTVANATTYRGGPFSVAAAFGGVLPKYWGLIIENRSGGTLDADAADHSISWQGICTQYT